jgi:hypothetical protein
VDASVFLAVLRLDEVRGVVGCEVAYDDASGDFPTRLDRLRTAW